MIGRPSRGDLEGDELSQACLLRPDGHLQRAGRPRGAVRRA